MTVQGYPEPFYAPGWEAPRAAREPLAVAALVTALLMLGPVAVVLGVAALRRVRRRGSRGSGMARAAIALGVVGSGLLVVGTALVVANVRAAQPLTLAIDEPRTAHARQLQVGHCLADLAADGPVGEVRVVPCSTPHAAEVAHVATLAGGWPGQEAADRSARALCHQALQLDRVLGDADLAGLAWVAWAPSATSWRAGDRSVMCLVHRGGDGLTERLTAPVLDLPVQLARGR